MTKGRKKAIANARGINEDSPYFAEFIKLSKRIQQNIRKYRQEQNLTQEQMEDFGLNLRQFQRIENGETRNITLANLFKISKALNIEVGDLLYD